jgi:hypothetical protein
MLLHGLSIKLDLDHLTVEGGERIWIRFPQVFLIFLGLRGNSRID